MNKLIKNWEYVCATLFSFFFLICVTPRGKLMNLLWTIENTVCPGDTWFGWYFVVICLLLSACAIFISTVFVIKKVKK